MGLAGSRARASVHGSDQKRQRDRDPVRLTGGASLKTGQGLGRLGGGEALGQIAWGRILDKPTS